MRNHDLPIYVIEQEKVMIEDFEWSRHHSNIIATIQAPSGQFTNESKQVNFWNISEQKSHEPNNASTVHITKPFAKKQFGEDLVSIAWRPKPHCEKGEKVSSENKYMVVTSSGILGELKYKVRDVMPLNFSSKNEISFANENKMFFYNFMWQHNLKSIDKTYIKD